MECHSARWHRFLLGSALANYWHTWGANCFTSLCSGARTFACIYIFDSAPHCNRYVDDYFASTPEDDAEGCMKDFAALARLILGTDAISARKLEHGNPLCILGLSVTLDASGMSCRPHEDKTQKWTDAMKEALCTDSLAPGAASKLAGGLSWACQNMFSRHVCHHTVSSSVRLCIVFATGLGEPC